MQINLFRCSAENERINKNLYISQRFVMDGTLKQSTSIIDPVIRIQKTNPAELNYNYMYIAEFNRFYYITDIVNITENIWEIHAHVDVLYTWMNDIYNMEGIADKLEDLTNANVYYDDGSFVMDCRNDLQVIEFPSGLNTDGSYILICAGGA